MEEKELQKKEDRAHEALSEAVNNFERQFNATVAWTGHHCLENYDGEIVLTKYCEIDDLIITKINSKLDEEIDRELHVNIGGYFKCDARLKEETIGCRLALRINHEQVSGDRALYGGYNQRTKSWTVDFGP